MKRLLIVCILAALLCAGLAMLVQSCVPAQKAAPPAASPGMAPAQVEPTPALPKATPASASGEMAQDDLPDPDLCGTIEAVDGTTLLLDPVRVTAQGEGWAVAAGGGGTVETAVAVQTDAAQIETVIVYNGGHEPPQPADKSALTPGDMVYLYGTWTGETFAAQRIVVLQMGQSGDENR